MEALVLVVQITILNNRFIYTHIEIKLKRQLFTQTHNEEGVSIVSSFSLLFYSLLVPIESD